MASGAQPKRTAVRMRFGRSEFPVSDSISASFTSR